MYIPAEISHYATHILEQNELSLKFILKKRSETVWFGEIFLLSEEEA